MQELMDRKAYGPELALKIEVMGSITVGVANRWMLGWRDRVPVCAISRLGWQASGTPDASTNSPEFLPERSPGSIPGH